MKEIVVGCFFVLVIVNQTMDARFIIGFISGAYVATKYNLKPYFDLAEVKIRKQIADFQKEISEKKPPE